MNAQELDVSDQVSDTELELDVLVQTHELVVRREVIAANRPVEFGSQRFDQNLAATTRRDLEDGKQVSSKAPRPKLFAVVFVARFINVEMTLRGDRVESLLIRIGEALAHFANQFLNQSTAQFDADDVMTVFLDLSDRHVADALKPTDQGSHFRSHQSGTANVVGQRAVVCLATVDAGLFDAMMLGDFDRIVDQFDTLMFLGLGPGICQRASTARATVVAILQNKVDLLVKKRLPFMSFVTGLSPDLAFSRPSWLASFGRRIGNVAGRWLGRRGRVSICLGELVLDRNKLLLQFGDFRR